jgi:hypothetical protein
MATSQPPPRSTVTPSVRTDLPPELLPAIFEDLQDGALRSCALVRRQWRWPAQRRLFRQVYVDRHKHFLALTETLRASPHLRPFVKILELSINSSSASVADRADGLFPAVEELRAIGQDLVIAARLPQLRILKVMTGHFEAEEWRPRQAPSARLPIALECIHFENSSPWVLLPEWFTQWVALTDTHAAQSLKELRISSHWPVHSTPAYIQAFLSAHTHLNRLELCMQGPSIETRPGASYIMLILPGA